MRFSATCEDTSVTDISNPNGLAADSAAAPRILPAAIVDAVLPDIPGGEENLLPISALDDDLKVTLPRWAGSNPEAGRPETVSLLWNGEVVAEKTWTAPIPDSDLFILLPHEHLTEGVHELGYEVKLWSGNVEGSEPLTLTIDTTKPQGLVRLKFDNQVEIAGITRQYLESKDYQVPATVPDYGFKPGDRLVAYWEKLPDGDDEVLEVDLTESLELIFDGEVIESLGNGTRYVTYRVMDRAGNLSDLSAVRVIEVKIEAPGLRPMPHIVQASQGNPAILDPKNATSGVTARVPEQSDDISRTEVTVYWKGYGDLGSFQTATPTQPGGLDFRIPATAIPANFKRDLEVYYSVAFLDYPDNEPEISEVYALRVTMIDFQPIKCDQSINGVVKLSSVPASGAGLTLPAWQYKPLAEGMLVNLSVIAFDHQDLEFTENLLVEQPVPANAQPVTATLAKAILQRVKIATSFTLRAEVSFDNGDSYHAFRLLDLRLDP